MVEDVIGYPWASLLESLGGLELPTGGGFGDSSGDMGTKGQQWGHGDGQAVGASPITSQ